MLKEASKVIEKSSRRALTKAEGSTEEELLKALVLVLVSFFTVLAAPFGTAQSGDETDGISLALTTTYESISVYASFSNDANANNFASFRWRKSGDEAWKQGMAMTADRRATVFEGGRNNPTPVANAYANQWRASIIGVQPDTSYDVEVTFTDPDGVVGTNPATKTVTTRTDNPPSNGRSLYVDGTNGNDANDGLSDASALRTIQAAANIVQAGDTVYIEAGTYPEQVVISRSGTDRNFITFRNYGSDAVTIDGENTRTYNMNIGRKDGTSEAHYIRVKGLRMVNAVIAIDVNYLSTNIIIEDNYMEGFSTNGIFVGYFRTTGWGNSENITIRRNTVVRNVSAPQGESPHLINIWQTRGGIVIRNNTIRDTTGLPRGANSYWDCIGGGRNFALGGFVNKDSDIYNNTIEGCNDDAIESEGANMNVRIWENTIRGANNSFIGLAEAPIITGPYYAFRNKVYGTFGSGMLKLNEYSQGEGYFYHNTFYAFSGASAPDGFKQTGTGLWNITSRNNVIRVNRYVIEFTTVGASPTHDFNYDAIYTTDYENRNRFVQVGGVQYATIAALRAANQERNGLARDTAAEFVDPANGNFNLIPNSQLIDKGEVIAGFNDQNSLWPYQGTAPDIGAFEYDSGAPSFGFSVSASPSRGTVTQGQSVTATVTASLSAGTTQQVSFSASGLPSGTSASFSPASCNLTCSSTMNITTAAATSAGNYPITVTGTAGGLTRTASYTLTVSAAPAPPPAFSFTLGLSSRSATVVQGGSASSTVTASLTAGTTQQVSFSASGLPSGASASFTPASCSPDCTSTMSITTTAATPEGNYPITVTGSAGGITRTAAYTLSVSASDTFPPVISGGQPLGVLPAGTTQALIRLSTDEAATCRYSRVPGVAYAAMTSSFSTTGSVSHSSLVYGLGYGGFYEYYVRCQDSTGNVNAADFPIRFGVSPPKFNISSGFELLTPVIVNGSSINVRVPLSRYENSGLFNVSAPLTWLNISNVRVNESGFLKTPLLNATDIFWEANASRDSFLLFEIPSPKLYRREAFLNRTYYRQNFSVSAENRFTGVQASLDVNSTYTTWRLYWLKDSSWVDASSLFRLNISGGTANIYDFNTSEQQFMVEGTTDPCRDADFDSYYSVSDCGVGNDCNDASASINPGAADVCGNGVDEDCSGSDAACTAAQQTASSTGGGGGGGGGSSLSSESATLQKELKAGDSGTFTFKKYADHGINELVAETGSYAKNPSFTVAETMLASSMPEPISKDAGKVYKYMSITTPSMKNVTKATVRFSVPKEWLDGNGLDPSSVSLHRLVSGSWARLQTIKAGSDSKFVSYGAVSEGFSIFAITAEKAGEMTASDMLLGKPSGSQADDAAAQPGQQSKAKEPPEPASQPRQKERGFGFAVRIVATVALMLLGVLIVIAGMRKLRHV